MKNYLISPVLPPILHPRGADLSPVPLLSEVLVNLSPCPPMLGVLDKGTLDALLCGDNADEDSQRMVAEVWRVLEPGGSYVMITSQAPQGRYRCERNEG